MSGLWKDTPYQSITHWEQLAELHKRLVAQAEQSQAVSQLPAAQAFDAYIEQEHAKEIERRCPSDCCCDCDCQIEGVTIQITGCKTVYCDWFSCPPKNLG